MRKIIFTLLTFISLNSLFAQTELLVKAKGGLNIRSDTSLNSEIIGKFNYAEKIKVLKKMDKYFELIDNEKKIKGQWYKVKGKSLIKKIVTGYVFSGFLTKPKQKDIYEFISYNDDYDYFLLNAQKEKSFYQFINDENDDRSYLRGDIIEIEWKEDVIYFPGDGDTKEIGDWIISTRKIKNGSVSNFRETYKKDIKYNYTHNYSQSFLDNIYLIVEYYIANSKNNLIKKLIEEKKQLEFSIDKRKRNDIDYFIFGISHSFEHKTSTIQWLYYNNVNEKLYEYDLPNDKLVEYKY